MMSEIEHQKCSCCKCYRPLEQFLNDKGRKLKSCQKCRTKQKEIREKNKCEHNKRKSYCKQCGGASICQHNKRKSYCKQCCGSQICEHNIQKSRCKECGGASICEHNREKSKCKECGGASICEHNKIKYGCKDCGDPIKITLKNMISDSRRTDKKYKRYDPNNFIDYCFLEGLYEDYPNCYWQDCNIKLQYKDYKGDLATIERLDNSIGHIKSNCVFACMKCNSSQKSNKTKLTKKNSNQ